MAGKSKTSKKEVQSSLPLLQVQENGRPVYLVVRTINDRSLAYRVTVTDIQSVDPGGFIAIVESVGEPRVVGRMTNESPRDARGRKRL